jgi:hypothetical protein
MICFADLPIFVEEMPTDISDAAAEAVAVLLLDLVEKAAESANNKEGGE